MRYRTPIEICSTHSTAEFCPRRGMAALKSSSSSSGHRTLLLFHLLTSSLIIIPSLLSLRLLLVVYSRHHSLNSSVSLSCSSSLLLAVLFIHTLLFIICNYCFAGFVTHLRLVQKVGERENQIREADSNWKHLQILILLKCTLASPVSYPTL